MGEPRARPAVTKGGMLAAVPATVSVLTSVRRAGALTADPYHYGLPLAPQMIGRGIAAKGQRVRPEVPRQESTYCGPASLAPARASRRESVATLEDARASRSGRRPSLVVRRESPRAAAGDARIRPTAKGDEYHCRLGGVGICLLMAVELDLARGWRLGGDLSAPEAALAAAELEATLGPVGEQGVEIALSHGGAAGEGFRRRAAPQRRELHGESPRALLFGAYATLEELGARWPWPGAPPARVEGARLEEEVEDEPALSGRCLVLGERALVEDVESWIVWAARQRLSRGAQARRARLRTRACASPQASASESFRFRHLAGSGIDLHGRRRIATAACAGPSSSTRRSRPPSARRPGGARLGGDQTADQRPRRQRHRRGDVPRRGRRRRPLPHAASAGRLARSGPGRALSRAARRPPYGGSPTGLGSGPARIGRGVLERGPSAWTAARLLPAPPGPARPPGRPGRLGPQARLPVLAAAHPGAGLRVQQPSPTPKPLRRLEPTAGAPKGAGGSGVWPTNHAMRRAERELARQAEAAYPRTVADRHATNGPERDTGTRIPSPSKRQAPRQGNSPTPRPIAPRRPRPRALSQGAAQKSSPTWPTCVVRSEIWRALAETLACHAGACVGAP
jgi:hypothetical protein